MHTYSKPFKIRLMIQKRTFFFRKKKKSWISFIKKNLEKENFSICLAGELNNFIFKRKGGLFSFKSDLDINYENKKMSKFSERDRYHYRKISRLSSSKGSWNKQRIPCFFLLSLYFARKIKTDIGFANGNFVLFWRRLQNDECEQDFSTVTGNSIPMN